MDLDVQLDSTDAGPVVAVRGSIDIASRDRLAQVAAIALAQDSSQLVLDLSGVTFIDSTGIGTLVTLAGDTDEGGGRFVLRNPSRPVSRILEVAGLADRWVEPVG